MAYRIEITRSALDSLKSITDRRVRDSIVRRIDTLVDEPSKQGKMLRGQLAGLISVRAVGQRHRVVYRIDDEKRSVSVVLVGIRREGDRRDIYALAQRLVRRGLI